MAKATLPANFKDDVMSSSMGGKRRYNLIHNSDGTVSLEDVTSYTQVGNSFGAAQVNAINTAVNASVDKAVVIDDLADIAANTTPGKVAGALALAELNRDMAQTAIPSSYFPLSSAWTLDTFECIKIGKIVVFNFAIHADTVMANYTYTICSALNAAIRPAKQTEVAGTCMDAGGKSLGTSTFCFWTNGKVTIGTENPVGIHKVSGVLITA